LTPWLVTTRQSRYQEPSVSFVIALFAAQLTGSCCGVYVKQEILGNRKGIKAWSVREELTCCWVWWLANASCTVSKLMEQSETPLLW
jgi:multisubunit Na+/H+ antiporter MnhE subunit